MSKIYIFLLLFMAILFFTTDFSKKKQPLNLSQAERDTIVGEYFGYIYSGDGDNPSVTKFYVDQSDTLLGSYEFHEEGVTIGGDLFNFERGENNQLTCNWKDRYGVGTLSIIFTEDMTSFEGKWSIPKSIDQYSWNGKKI